MVLSHYDLGVIEQIHPLARGSRRAAKLLIRSERGKFLLKRRARGKDQPMQVAFSHDIQLTLAGHRFPLPQLVGTRLENNSMLQLGGSVYEMFEFVEGRAYGNSVDATADAGKTLGYFHRFLAGHQTQFDAPNGSFHGVHSVIKILKRIPQTLSSVTPGRDARTLSRVTTSLERAYESAKEEVDHLGLQKWPVQIVHADWHPGNMVYRNGRIIAVTDYDAARIHQRILDVANGALQFSVLRGNREPSTWPKFLDVARYEQFLRGYHKTVDRQLDETEARAIPWLMIESLIVESAIPIATTGMFGFIEGGAFLKVVHRKVRWIHDHAEKLRKLGTP